MSTTAPHFETGPQVCDRLGIGMSTLYRLIRAGEVTRYKFGRAARFNVEEVNAWAQGRIDVQASR